VFKDLDILSTENYLDWLMFIRVIANQSMCSSLTQTLVILQHLLFEVLQQMVMIC